MNSRRRAVAFAASAAALLIATGHAGAAGTAGRPAASDSGGTVIFGYGTDGGQNYDPQQSANIYALSYMLPVFDTLLTVDDGALAPGLATEWTVSDDGTTIELTLRDGVTFHDGAPFDSAAVQASLERGQTLDTSTISQFLAPITAIDTPDPQTVALTVEPGNVAALLGAFTDRAGMIVSPDAADRDDFTRVPVGTGPYAVSDESILGQEMVYERFEGYWDESVQLLDTYVVRLVAAPATEAAVEGSTVDIAITTYLPDETVDRIASGGEWVLDEAQVQSLFMFYLAKGGVFADERVRQAVSYAVDRTQMTAALGSDCTPDSQAVTPTSPHYDPELPVVERDLDRARELLADAGMPDGFSFSATVISGNPQYTNAMQVVQQQLSEVGIDLTIEPLPPTELLAAFGAQRVDAYFSNFPGAEDPNSWMTTLSTIYSPGPADPDLGDLAAAVAGEVEPGARVDLVHDWQARYQESAWHIGLCNTTTEVLTRGVTGLNWQLPTALDPRGLAVQS